MPLRDSAEAYLARINRSARHQLELKELQGDTWQQETWEFHPKDDYDFHWVPMMSPPISGDIVLPFVQNIAKLGYDPSRLASYHFRNTAQLLRSLAYPNGKELPIVLSAAFPHLSKDTDTSP